MWVEPATLALTLFILAYEQRSGRSPTLHFSRKAFVSSIWRDDLRLPAASGIAAQAGVVRLGKMPK